MQSGYRAAGITVAAGTDAGNPGTLHGPSIYRELQLLAEAGLTPMEVLLAATRNAARAMGREAEVGTLEAGKAAGLVALDANPLEDVRNYQRVQWVMKGGYPADFGTRR
jgi:imidazolonepropionase-like amidohydrolase